ncbi:MAG: N-acetylneuraminate synthase [Halobacteriovoraceae bacterium]|jgi:N,N'-diacetyllegionaminate synthase|nr:N-acetylneuraminate synthase [Halobacteriovoraceae bacterium]
MKTLIIAEAGVNHNGDLHLAKKLIDVACDAGADYVKFQLFKTELVISKFAKKAEYQKETTDPEESQLEMVKKLELSKEEHFELLTYCKKKDIKYLSSPFDHWSIDLLEEMNTDLYKVPSGEITNLPYLRKISTLNKPIIVSTGMATLTEVRDCLEVLMSNGITREMITVLHCNTEYPTPMIDVNLNAMNTIKNEFHVNVGYSDHTNGIEVPIAAVALGATVIEKHFTLDHDMEGPDHRASLNPAQLKSMISAIKNIEIALGSDEKKPSPSEAKNSLVARKSIIAKKSISKGETLTIDNLTVKRPGDGISPMRWDSIIGMEAVRDFKEDEQIEL